jgi:hypothetical protein
MKFIKIKHKRVNVMGKLQESVTWINTSNIVTLRKINDKTIEIRTTDNQCFDTSLSIDELIILINS